MASIQSTTIHVNLTWDWRKGEKGELASDINLNDIRRTLIANQGVQYKLIIHSKSHFTNFTWNKSYNIEYTRDNTFECRRTHFLKIRRFLGIGGGLSQTIQKELTIGSSGSPTKFAGSNLPSNFKDNIETQLMFETALKRAIKSSSKQNTSKILPLRSKKETISDISISYNAQNAEVNENNTKEDLYKDHDLLTLNAFIDLINKQGELRTINNVITSLDRFFTEINKGYIVKDELELEDEVMQNPLVKIFDLCKKEHSELTVGDINTICEIIFQALGRQLPTDWLSIDID